MSVRSKSLPPTAMSIEEQEKLYELLKGLTPREQAIIRPVLERDLEFQRREKARVRQLKTLVEVSETQHQPLPVVKRKVICPLMQSMSTDSMTSIASFRSNKPPIPKLPPQPPQGRACSNCQCRLGIVFNAGSRCAYCGQLLCAECRRAVQRSKFLCPSCYVQREIRAASGEWVDGGDPAEVSEVLMAQMRRVSVEKAKQEEQQRNTVVHVRAPMISRRQLTLPTVVTPRLLAVPSESDLEALKEDGESNRFCGGSPSPKSHGRKMDMHGSGKIHASLTSPSCLQAGLHPREVIGSPAPRTTSPGMPTPTNGDARFFPSARNGTPTPTSLTSQLNSPQITPRATPSAIPKSSSRIPTINNNSLLQPIDKRSSAMRKQTPISANGNHCTPERNGTAKRDEVAHSSRAPTANANSLRNPQERTPRARPTATSNPEMGPNITPSASVESDMWQRCDQARPTPNANATHTKEAMIWETGSTLNNGSCRRPVEERRARLLSQDTSSMSSSKTDHLDVVSCDSRRSSGISSPSRSVVGEVRSQKDGFTSASSRDSLSVTSLTTEVSTDYCTKSSVASQASCEITPTFRGEVQLIIAYDLHSACISVHVIQCRSLPHFGSHKPNPYVKVVLVPKCPISATVLKHKTTPKKSDINPVFDQIIKFPRICKSEMEQCHLLVSIWHKDLLSQNSLIGEVTSEDLCPWKMASANVHIRLTFSLSDRERRIGPLSLLLRDVHFFEIPQIQAAQRHAVLVASAKLYFNEKQMERRRSESRRRDQVENQWNWSTTFPKQNLNDLHLRSLKLKIKLQTGPFGYKTIGEVIFNDYEHRRGKTPLQACGCLCCSSWRKLIDNPSVPIEVELPLTITNK